ncbi:MAG: hypothetical protein ACTSSE_16015 [Candidatus Thorarchaeota archaeon]
MWNKIKDHVDMKAKELSEELRSHPDITTKEMQQSGFHPHNMNGKLLAYQEMQVFLNQIAEPVDASDTIECPTCFGCGEQADMPYCPFCKGTVRVPKPSKTIDDCTSTPLGIHNDCGEIVYRADKPPHDKYCWKCGNIDDEQITFKPQESE